MSATDDTDPDQDDGEATLRAWRQGDCVLGDHWFAYRIDPANPITEAARAAARDGADLAEAPVAGFAVVTQTCDIVRSGRGRDFIEVCPLVNVDEAEYKEISRSSRPQYAAIPALTPDRLVADLGRVMTVEKPVVERWTRVPGWTTDAESVEFTRALARRRERFAFPDEFVSYSRALHKRIKDKHGRDSDEGRALKAIQEIRVYAHPEWRASQVSLRFWFIKGEGAIDPKLDGWVEKWLALLPESGHFSAADGYAVTLSDMTAAEYLASNRFDLDWLST